MNAFLLLIAAFVAFLLVRQLARTRPAISLEEAKAALKSGTAVLVDVREPLEWPSGVAQNAALLSFSDLRASAASWRAFLEQNRSRKLLLYCASGTRSGLAAALLKRRGFDAVNAGSLRDWDRAGWPIGSPASR